MQIQLDAVHRHLLEHVQGGITAAEIVHFHFKARFPQLHRGADQQIGVFHYRLRKPKPLPHAERILFNMAFQVGVKPDFFHRLAHLLPADFVVQSSKQFEIFIPRIVWYKPRRFNDYAHILWEINIFSHTLSVNGYLARCDFYKPADALHQHCFPRAVSPDKSVDFTLVKLHRNRLKYFVFSDSE